MFKIMLEIHPFILCYQLPSYQKEKKLWTMREGGEAVQVKEAYNEQDDAQFVVGEIKQLCAEGSSLRDFAVFYRTNAQSRVLEDALRRLDMP